MEGYTPEHLKTLCIEKLTMTNPVDSPLLLFVFCLVLLWLAAWAGDYLRRRRRQEEAEREDLGVIVGAVLTLLGLIIGFSFSMAVSRYDQRKNLEEGEANAIGTEYLRAGLFPSADAAKVRALLQSYLDQRTLFYTTRGELRLAQINAQTAQLQSDLWSAVQAPAAAQPTQLAALAVAGMNDVLNSQGYTQAAWLNRIPGPAWCLLIAIAICCNLLVGYSARSIGTRRRRLIILPLIVAVAFFMIADLDAPRSGIIMVSPQNLINLSKSLGSQ